MVKKSHLLIIALFLLIFTMGSAVSAQSKQRIFDNAGALTEGEVRELEELSEEYSEKNKIDFIFLTSTDTEGKTIEEYAGDFADDHEIGYGSQPNGSAALLAINISPDPEQRRVQLMGFEQAEQSLDDARLNQIREKITPDLSEGNYAEAFQNFILISDEYLEYRDGVNPESIFFKWWFQAIVSVILAGIVVGTMAFNSGGRVTVNNRTYFDDNNTRVNSSRDIFVNKTVTKRRKPSNNNKGGGGGRGGGMTGGGRSFSGSSGKF